MYKTGPKAKYRQNTSHGTEESLSTRPAKRAHVQDFVESSRAQWGWLAKEKEYRVEIGKLKQQIEGLKYQSSLQIDADTGDKSKLIQENKALRV